MNSRRFLLQTALLALMLLTAHGALGYAQTPSPPVSGTNSGAPTAEDGVNDARLRSAALLRLAADPAVDARNFDVAVRAGAVTLVSRASTAAELSRAEQLVRDATGGAQVTVDGDVPAQTGESIDGPLQVPLAERYETYVRLGTPSDQVFEAPTQADEGSGTDTVARAASGDRPRTYTVQSGDNLSAIASRTMGDGLAWPRIFEMNRSVIGPNPDGLRAGMVLRIPQD